MDLTEQLKRDEGSGRPALHPYRDTENKLTIGYGRNLDDAGITPNEADYLLANDIQRANGDVEQALPWAGGLGEARRAVLVNMAFNMGIGGLMEFRKFLAALQAEDFEGAALEMLDSKWAAQVGARAHRLAEQMRTGEWI